MDAAKNFAKGTLSQGYDDAATSIVLTAGDGARFPAASFNAVWWNASDYPDPADDPTVEIVRVTAKSTDTFTVTRGVEGSGASTHQLEGKTYKLIAGLTAKVINDEMLNVSKSGDDVTAQSAGQLILASATGQVELSAGPVVRLNNATGVHGFGDVDNLAFGTSLIIDEPNDQVSLKGKIGTDQTAAATTPGTVTKKLEIFNHAGTSLGFIAIYDAIT